jgi:hypothetical protein
MFWRADSLIDANQRGGPSLGTFRGLADCANVGLGALRRACSVRGPGRIRSQPYGLIHLQRKRECGSLCATVNARGEDMT